MLRELDGSEVGSGAIDAKARDAWVDVDDGFLEIKFIYFQDAPDVSAFDIETLK